MKELIVFVGVVLSIFLIFNSLIFHFFNSIILYFFHYQ